MGQDDAGQTAWHVELLTKLEHGQKPRLKKACILAKFDIYADRTSILILGQLCSYELVKRVPSSKLSQAGRFPQYSICTSRAVMWIDMHTEEHEQQKLNVVQGQH